MVIGVFPQTLKLFSLFFLISQVSPLIRWLFVQESAIEIVKYNKTVIYKYTNVS